ncbi:MAG: tRNA isopentenyl-2-thiomethyl-A-37 hydroxylase MiaE [Pseudomonadota bacterium]|nr:tRNA isopentenyl-2-thiomethyl-A-37 hydroxylase MiaE [Pseudomonadota bacterium]
MSAIDLQPLFDFLPCRTPELWLEQAMSQRDILLIDHANCEKKAAATAMHILFKYTDTAQDLPMKMSQLAREELLHYEQVLGLMKDRGVNYDPLSPSRYASGMRSLVRSHEPAKIVDTLVVGAFIEARSCERFHALSSRIEAQDPELAKYYRFLLKSESRHFQDYLDLSYAFADTEEVQARIEVFREKEHELIAQPDSEFRFHSGPVSA